MSQNGVLTTRRALLTVAALAPAAALTEASRVEAIAAEDSPRNSAPAPAYPAVDNYVPKFFARVEWAFVNAACDRLIPRTYWPPPLPPPVNADRSVCRRHTRSGRSAAPTHRM
jgi:hypothetical protein